MVEERLKRDKRDAFNAAHPAGGLFTNLKRSAKKIAKRVKGDNDKATDEKATAPLRDGCAERNWRVHYFRKPVST